jgi:hypothetical protein
VREDIHPNPAAVRRDIHHLCQKSLEHGSCPKMDCTISFVWLVIFCPINIAISGNIIYQCWGKTYDKKTACTITTITTIISATHMLGI